MCAARAKHLFFSITRFFLFFGEKRASLLVQAKGALKAGNKKRVTCLATLPQIKLNRDSNLSTS